MAAENAGSGPLHTVVETPAYLSAAAGVGLPEEERRKIVDALAARPMSGDLMEGTGDARKLRWAGRGKGKSGGYRIVTFFADEGLPVFLLTVFGKGDRDNLTKAERNGLSELTKRLMDSYRAGIRRKSPPNR